MNCKNKVLSLLISLLSASLSSISNVAAKPGDFLVYFVGRYPDKDNSLSYKQCYVCGKNLAERCLQFCCREGCKECSATNLNAYFGSHLSGCRHVKKNFLKKIKSNGYFCFIDYNDHNNDYVFSFNSANSNKKLYCAYCIKKHLEDKYSLGKDDKCLICLDKFGKKDKLLACCSGCNKLFHSACIEKWKKTKEEAKANYFCPNCKSKEEITYVKTCDRLNMNYKSFNNIGVMKEINLPPYGCTKQCMDCEFEENGGNILSDEEDCSQDEDDLQD